MGKWQRVLLWGSFAAYLAGRVCQLYADRLPTLLIVVLHVVPPALFALVHGSILYRFKGMILFAVCCLGLGGVSEMLSLRTGIPFGHYHFTEVMGPKVLGLPVLLVLAYLGVGYCSWVLGLIILGYRNQPLSGVRAVVLPAVASGIMLAWDLSMEADWSTLDRAWIWRDGGAFYGVPLRNFVGWYVTAFLFYGAFALTRRNGVHSSAPRSRSYWRAAVLMYAACAFGNLLVLRLPMAPAVVSDASGRQWLTAEVLRASAFVSCAVMGPIALLAWVRLGLRDSGREAVWRTG